MIKRAIFAVLAVLTVVLVAIIAFRVPTVTVGVAINDRAALSASEGAMLSVIQSYVTWYNDQKRPLRLSLEIATYRDDPTEALESLASRRVAAVVGFPLSLEAVVAVPVAERLRLPVISPAASSSTFSGKEDWFFRVVEDSQGEGVQIGRFLSAIGSSKVAVYRSPYNDVYVNQLVEDVEEHSSVRVGGISSYPGGANDLSGDAILVVAEPSRTYWIIQDILLHWPPVPVVLARWSQGSDFKTLLAIPGGYFFFSSTYDPSEIPDDPFTTFLVAERDLDLGLFARHGAAAMAYLTDVLEENPKARGEALRSALSRPREVLAPGWRFNVDRFGDASADLKFFRLKDGAVSEVEP
nr:hypothetical protein [uncultured Dethiosulfovibrio sp.]